MHNERRRSKDLFKQFTKLFKEIDAKEIAEKTMVDEFSKKLNMREHLLIMLWHVVGNCTTRGELSESLKGILSERCKLIEIGKSQLSKVNKNRVIGHSSGILWIDWNMEESEALDIKERFEGSQLDSTFIIWKSKYSEIRNYAGFFKNVKNLEL